MLIMGKRIYPPMPQTLREAPGQLFQVLWRISSVSLEKYKPRWDNCPLPRFMQEPRKWTVATNLTKQEADMVRVYWQAKPDCGCFEFKVCSMDEKV